MSAFSGRLTRWWLHSVREQLVVAGLVLRVVAEVLLPAREGAAVVLAAHLPAAGVAAEERDVAAVADELLQVVAHRRGPVFVVPDAEHELVVLEQFGAEFEVGVDGSSRGRSRSSRPTATNGSSQRRNCELSGPVERHAAALDLVLAVVGVEAVAAPVRVGVVGVGRELKEDLRVLAWLFRAHDEEGRRESGALVESAADDLVVARGGIVRELELCCDRPVTPARRGVFWDGVLGCGELTLSRVRRKRGPTPHRNDGEPQLGRRGGEVQLHLVAGGVTQLVGVALPYLAFRLLRTAPTGSAPTSAVAAPVWSAARRVMRCVMVAAFLKAVKKIAARGASGRP